MCGRYASTRSTADLGLLLGVDADETDDHVLPAYNVAPTDERPVALVEDGRRVLRCLAWGLIPHWAETPAVGARAINARVESVAEKPTFARALRSRRCLVPADGWYEWTVDGTGRQPHFVRRADGAQVVFAGLHGRWHGPTGTVASYSILTGPAPAELAWLHDRAPLVIPEPLWDRWLDPAVDGESLLPELLSAPPVAFTTTAVSREVNNVRNDGPQLLTPADAQVALF